jgi:SAM-dependent methyltransferase
MSRRIPLEYSSDELDAMACARYYYQWIVGQWRPYLSGTVLEIGAGIGNFAAHLLAEPIRRLILVEPARELYERLRTRFQHDQRVELCNGVLEDAGDGLLSLADVVASVNVLEHIRDDVETLKAAHDVLRPGGILLVFVPAFNFLYGSMDRTFGHVRRYTKKTLTHKLVEAGFAPVRVKYMNLLGMVPWFLAGRLFRSRTLTPAMVVLSDRTMIRLTARLEAMIEAPCGQSVMAIATKP